MSVRFSARPLAIAAAVVIAMLSTSRHSLEAKAPGVTHCYKGICHRVRTLEETRMLLGSTLVMAASHYDFPWNDRFNVGAYTSNGERFDAGDADRVSSSDLPDGTELLLRNPQTGRVSHVRVNDFGPFHGNRLLDVTRRVAEDLGFAKRGVTDLEVTIIAIPRDDDLTYRRNRARTQAMGPLGEFGEADMPGLITRKLAARSPADAARIIIAQPLHLRPRPVEDAQLTPPTPAAEPPSQQVAEAAQRKPQQSNHQALIEIHTEPEMRPASTEMEVAPEPSATTHTLPEANFATVTSYTAVAGLAEVDPAAIPSLENGLVPLVEPSIERGVDPAETLHRDMASRSDLHHPIAHAATATAPAYSDSNTGGAAIATLAAQPSSTLTLLLTVMMLLTMAIATASWNTTPATARASPPKEALRKRRTPASTHVPIAREAASAPPTLPATPPLRPTAVPAPAPVSASRAPDTGAASPTAATLAPATSLIDAALSFTGTLRATGHIAIAGFVGGSVEARGIEVLYGGQVRGALSADEVFINGNVEGPITARLVRIGPNARVLGAITCIEISIEETAAVEADIRRPRIAA